MKHLFSLSLIVVMLTAMSFVPPEPPIKSTVTESVSSTDPLVMEAQIKVEALKARIATKFELRLISEGKPVILSLDRLTPIEKAEFDKYANVLLQAGLATTQRCCTACTPIPGGPAVRTCCIYWYINGMFMDCQQEICDLWAPEVEEPCS
jgi:hypothetical protein